MSDPVPETAELTYTRVFDAPRELVFRCMTEPEHLAHFWGPIGTHTPAGGITADVQPGGVFETVMVSDADGSRYTMRAVYVEVVPPERLVWTEPGTVEREIEDLEAVIGAAGGTAFLYGHSSGCALVIDTVLHAGGTTVPKIALYEAPYDDDPAAEVPWTVYLDDLAAALAAGRRGDAVARFMAHVGMPAEQIAGMRQSPFFPALEAIAPTLAYDHAGLMGDSLAVPVGQAARVTVPALVMYGDASLPFTPATARTLSAAMPHARLRALEGQTHDVDPAVQAPVLAEFFAG